MTPEEKRIVALERQLAAERAELTRARSAQQTATNANRAQQVAIEKFGTYAKTYGLNRPEYRADLEFLADDVIDAVSDNPSLIGDLPMYIRGRVNRMKQAGMFKDRPKPVTAPKGAASGVVAAGQRVAIDPKLSIEDQIEQLDKVL